MRAIRVWLFAVLAAALLLGCGSSSDEKETKKTPSEPLGAPFAIAGDPVGDAVPIAAQKPVPREYGHPVELTKPADRKQAPESGLTKVGGWLNTTRAFTGEDLKGRILILDFWTAGCINCIHVAATLETFAHKHETDPILVLGVHAQKFSADAPPEVVRAQMEELGITHPVAIDSKHQEFSDWEAPGWPTLFVVDAHGRIIKQIGGEPSVEYLDNIVESALHEQAAEGGLATEALDFLGREKDPSAPLSSPEKVIPTATGYAIADSGHDRVVLTDDSGATTDVIGDGTEGTTDGDYATARFFAPKGLALMGNVLYVGDTANHLIRAVDLTNKTVTTVAGTGKRGGVLHDGGKALETSLASPWDLLAVDTRIFVANAGTHQVFVFDPAAATVEPFAGNGYEGLVDGTADEVRMAQPSGLASDGTYLYVADAESSSIRKIDIATGAVTTLVGQGLFVWGAEDGPAASATLQHDQGLALDGQTLYIADTYNSKIRALDLSTMMVSTIAGDGSPPPFFYPGGLTVVPSDSQMLLVADTNHDTLQLVDVTGTKEPVRWDVTGLSPP
ncbi:MAG: redoxin domain-containing protein [Polyangiaceae bacterium]|nr:redoxin domain-containing protein [Polyangiaceae bacterium]